MIYLIIGLFLTTVSIVTLIYIVIKIHEQKTIKNKRLETLKKNSLLSKEDHLKQSLFELYTKSYSHYFIYCIGHFFSILLNIYSIILSIASLSTITIGMSDDLTQTISLLSTFFVITLVFSRLDERSKGHHSIWRRHEKNIVLISELISNCDNIYIVKNDIYLLIVSNEEENLKDELF